MDSLTNIPALNYNGLQISEKGEKLSLTDMWRASGFPMNKEPAQWLRKESAKEFIEYMESGMLKKHTDLIRTIKGGKTGGGTWAHWQIALAYAKYLSPEFHIWCNQIIRAHMEGRATVKASALTEYDRSIMGSMIKSCAGVAIRDEISKVLPQFLTQAIEAAIAERNLLFRYGKTAHMIWVAHNLPRLRGISKWFGNRLSEMGCGISDNGKADIGGRGIRLYDPDKAEICLKNGLLRTAQLYASERMGQRKLRLVSC